jgi:integrating conjugative element protein (TIGR03749 family)
MKRLLILMMTALVTCVHADGTSRLTLTNAEMQKLKKYFPDEENDHVTWKGEPIAIQLPVGKEKRLIFSSHVSVDVKGSLTTGQLRLLNNDKSIYLTALTAFPTTRIYVTVEETRKVILIDLSPSENADTRVHYIDIKEKNVVANPIVKASQRTDSSVSDTPEELAQSADVSYAELIRFAWQEVYAPARLLKHTAHYARAAMHTERFVNDLVYGDKVIAHPEASWMAGNRYVTVVSLQNKYPHTTHIDVRKDICGDWLAATLYPRSTLKPHGIKTGDSATLILVSQHSFGETVGVCHGDA